MLQRKIEQTLWDWKKAATGNTKSAKTILKNFDKYHVTKAIKVGDYNIGEMGGILTLPHYMVMCGVMEKRN